MLSVMSPFSIWLKAIRHCAATINPVLLDLAELIQVGHQIPQCLDR